MHFTYSVLVLVLLIFAHFQFNDGVNGHICYDMAGISQQPGKCFLLRCAFHVLDKVYPCLDHIARFLVVHPIRPLAGIGASDIEIRIVGADRAKLAKAEVSSNDTIASGVNPGFPAGRVP